MIAMGCWKHSGVYSDKEDLYNALEVEYYRKSLTIQLHNMGENHPELATSYNNIANVYNEKGELDHALEYHHKSLTIKLNSLGENHPDVAESLHHMGVLYIEKSQLDKAEDVLVSNWNLLVKITQSQRWVMQALVKFMPCKAI